jgi:hypothetical protein
MKEQKIEKSNFNCQKQLFAEKLKLGEFCGHWGNLDQIGGEFRALV